MARRRSDKALEAELRSTLDATVTAARMALSLGPHGSLDPWLVRVLAWPYHSGGTMLRKLTHQEALVSVAACLLCLREDLEAQLAEGSSVASAHAAMRFFEAAEDLRLLKDFGASPDDWASGTVQRGAAVAVIEKKRKRAPRKLTPQIRRRITELGRSAQRQGEPAVAFARRAMADPPSAPTIRKVLQQAGLMPPPRRRARRKK